MILLDTHVVIWLALIPEKISSGAAAAIRQGHATDGSLGISVVTLYEIANAIRRGRVRPAMEPGPFLHRIRRRFKVFPVSETIAVCAGQLSERFHGDPMDRMIAATAIIEKCMLITADDRIASAGVCKTLW